MKKRYKLRDIDAERFNSMEIIKEYSIFVLTTIFLNSKTLQQYSLGHTKFIISFLNRACIVQIYG